MTVQKKSNQRGVLKGETTDTQRDTQFTNAENQSISVTLASTVQKNQTSQHTPNSQNDNPNATYSKIVQVFGEKLVKLGKAEWRRVELKDGREVFALCFPTDKWLVDPVSKELTPL